MNEADRRALLIEVFDWTLLRGTSATWSDDTKELRSVRVR